MRAKTFKKESINDLKNRALSDKEIINSLKESLSNLDEKKYSFFNGVNKKKEMEYVYITEDNYIAYYTIPFNSKENLIEIDKLTERIKIDNGFLYRWNKKTKKFEKANIVKIEKCFLCKINFFKKKLINKLKNRLIFNVAFANINDKEKIDFLKKRIFS